MSILDEIDEIKRTIAEGNAALERKAAAGVEELRAEAAKLRDEIAGGAPRSWTLKTAQGQEITVSERDGLQLFAALPLCLARKTVTVTLQSGQTVELKMTDLEQLAAQIAPPKV